MSYDELVARLTDLGYSTERPNVFSSARKRVNRFDGSIDKYQKWRKRLDKYFTAVGTKGDRRVELIGQFVTGRAEELIDNFLSKNPRASWNKLCSFLDDNCTQKSCGQDYLYELSELKKSPNEDFKNLEFRIRELHYKAFPNEGGLHKERQMIFVLRNAVDEQTRDHLTSNVPRSFEDAIRLASEFSEASSTTDSNISSSKGRKSDPVVKKINAIVDKIDTVDEPGVAKGNRDVTSEQSRETGRCKWFKAGRGWGFIVPDRGGPDIFVHQSVIKKEGFRSLADGEKVEFVAKQSDRGRQATFVCGPGGRSCRGARRFIPRILQKDIKCVHCGRFANRTVQRPPQEPTELCNLSKNTPKQNANSPSNVVPSDRKNLPRSSKRRPHKRDGQFYRERS